MSRSLLFVLLLATSVVLADDALATEPATEEQAQTEPQPSSEEDQPQSEGEASSQTEGQPETGTESQSDAGDQAKTEGEASSETEDQPNSEGEAPSETEDQSKTEEAKPEGGPKVISGMSILGNQEAPKSLVIVPWKSSEIGASVGITTLLDDSKLPIDKEVFMRALSYYEIRSEKAP